MENAFPGALKESKVVLIFSLQERYIDLHVISLQIEKKKS